MATWADLRAGDPGLAAAGERLLRPDGAGVAFLATTRQDGGPRVHPVARVLAGDGLYVFIVNLSPKYTGLLRDGRYARHALSPATGGEEFYVTGRAALTGDRRVRQLVTAASGNRLGHLGFEVLFALDVGHVLHTLWRDWGTPRVWPEYTRWPGRGRE